MSYSLITSMSAETIIERLNSRGHKYWWLEEVEGGRVHVVFQAGMRQYGQASPAGSRVDRASLAWLRGDMIWGPSVSRVSVPAWHGASMSSTTWKYLGEEYTHDVAQRCMTAGKWLPAKRKAKGKEKDSLDEAAEAWAGVDEAMDEPEGAA